MTHETLGEKMPTVVHDASCEAERIPEDRRTTGCGCQSRQADAIIKRWVRGCAKQARADFVRARAERLAA